MQIKSITNSDLLWTNLIEYANVCTWEAWPILAQKMTNNEFSDWEKVFVSIDNDRIVWFCTFTKEDWIPECNYSPFVWFIFVDSNYRWKRISEKMINAAREYAKSLWFEKLYIVSDHKGLYEKYWFNKCDEMIDEMWRNESIFCRDIK